MKSNNEREKRGRSSMKKIKKILDMVFSVKMLLAIMCIVFTVCMILVKVKQEKRNNENENKLKQAEKYTSINKDDEEVKKDEDEIEDRYGNANVKEFRTLPSSAELCADMNYKVSVGNAMNELSVSIDNIEGVMIGADANGEGIERYYFTEREIIEKVIEKLENTELTKMINMGVDEYRVEEDWDIQLCYKDSEYALRIYGEPTNENSCYRTVIDEVYKEGYYTQRNELDDDLAYLFGSSKQLLFNSDIKDFLNEIIQERVEAINMSTALELCTAEELDLGTLFSFKHKPPIYTVDLGIHKCLAYIYVFPIEESEYRILMLRERSTGNGKPSTKIWRFELHNGKGEYIDMLTSTEEEIREFVDDK